MVNLKGQGGRLQACGRMLAVLGEWELQQDKGELRIGASVLRCDTYLLPRAVRADVVLELGGRKLLHNDLSVWYDGERVVLERGGVNG